MLHQKVPIRVALSNLEEICVMHGNQSLFLHFRQGMIDSLTDDLYRINLYLQYDIILHDAALCDNL